MQGKILIIDGISTNRIVLKVKLAAAFYDVVQAATLAQAVDLIRAERPDLVITAMRLPDGTATDLCKILRAHAPTASVPVLAVSGPLAPWDRLAALRAGALDVMQRPVDETLLLGRVRSMIRAHHQLAEWQMRDETSYALGLAEAPVDFVRPSTIALVGTDVARLRGWVSGLGPHLRARYSVALLGEAMASLHAGTAPDAVVLCLPRTPPQAGECLRLISAMRASVHTRDIALMVTQKTPDAGLASSALDMGADDLMPDGFEPEELALRLTVLLKRKRQVAQILQTVRTGLREVVNDPLTGLYNRRYAMPYLARLIERSRSTGSKFSVILADMDHFKRINDVYGHASGDAVLEETGRRLRAAVGSTDMVARVGGEEFMIALPGTDMATARAAANAICRAVGAAPFTIPGAAQPVRVTMSLGLTTGLAPEGSRAGDTVEAVLDRADKALYSAKLEGRNRVTLSQPQTRPAA